MVQSKPEKFFLPLNGSHDSEPIRVNEPSSGANSSGDAQEATNTRCPNLCNPAIKGCTECGIPGEDKEHKYSAKCLRETIAEAATQEWRNWSLAWERDPSRFGVLVEYWLSITGITNDALRDLRNELRDKKFGEIKWKRFDSSKESNAADWEMIPFDDQIQTDDKVVEQWMTNVVDKIPLAQNHFFVKEALKAARRSHFDWWKEKIKEEVDVNGKKKTIVEVEVGVGKKPWSAAFVVACIRSVEIDHKFANDNWLLFRNEAHIKYIWEAKQESKRLEDKSQKPKRYRTIKRTEKVEVGDIIVQDRQAKNFSDILSIDNVTKDTKWDTHGDIVVKVDVDHVIAIGGNLEFEPDFDQSGSVRQRRFPLKGDGTLDLEPDKRFWQEDDKGNLKPLRPDYYMGTKKEDKRNELNKYGRKDPYNLRESPTLLTRAKPVGALHPQSTARIFALLRLEDDCPK